MAYSTFAQYYDAAMGDRTPDVKYLKDIITRYRFHAKTILELGCGTGEILKGLGDQYELSGLDNSPQMLALAKQKLPKATFYQSEMAEFDLRRQFDVILCVCDTINQLPDLTQWRQMFLNVQKHLVLEGLFVFDMNTQHKLDHLAANDLSGHEADGNYYMFKVAKGENNVFDWTVKVFEHEPNNEFLQHEEHYKETTYPVRQIKELAESLFLQEVIIEDPFQGQVSDNSNRVVFICR